MDGKQGGWSLQVAEGANEDSWWGGKHRQACCGGDLVPGRGSIGGEASYSYMYASGWLGRTLKH